MTTGVATWNVNSLRVRLPQLSGWLAANPLDVVALQETKITDGDFPVSEIEALGLHAIYSGQKTYNGVAILAREPLTGIVAALPGFADEQKRVLAASVGGLRIVNVYVPNGQAVGSESTRTSSPGSRALQHFLRGELAGASRAAGGRRLQYRAGRPRRARSGRLGGIGAASARRNAPRWPA